MKKHIVFFLCLVVSWNISYSQTITTANMMVVGDSIKVTYVKAQGLSPGGSGSNQNWTFTNLTDSTTTVIYAVNPSTTAYSPSFPQSNLAIGDKDGNYDYFNNSLNEFVFNGHGNIYLTMPYLNPLIQFKFPMNYGDSYTSTMSSDYPYSGTTYYRRGTSTVLVDGSGTLTTPKGSFSNVLRVRTEQIFTDSAYYAGTSYIFPASSVTYAFLHPNFKHLIFDITYLSPASGGTYAFYRYYDQDISLGFTKRQKVYLSAYPNPSRNTLTIETDLNSEFQTIEMVDMLGKVMVSKHIHTNRTEIDLSGLSAGVYLLRINGRVFQKIIKE